MLECCANGDYLGVMFAMHKVKLLVIVAGLFVGAVVLFIGFNSDNGDAQPVDSFDTQAVAHSDLECGNGPIGVWSVGTNAAGTICARVTNDAGNDLFLMKGEDYFHARLSGLTPNTPYSFLARTKKDMLFSVSGNADIKGDLLMDLSTTISPRILGRLRSDNKLAFLPEEKGSPQVPLYFPLKGSGDALDIF